MDLRRLFARHRDAAFAAVAAALLATEVLLWDGARLPEGALFAALAGGALAWRRALPLPSFLVCFGATGAALWSAPGIDNNSLGILLVFFGSLYSLGRWTTGTAMWLGMLGVLGYVVVFLLGDPSSSVTHPGDVGFATLFVGTPWAAGVAIRLRRERERGLIEENEQAVARERARIARELHDVVSHAISVTVLQARGGRAQLGRDEDAVRRALDAIELTNTAALSDMRRLLAVLRDTETDGRAGTQTGAGHADDPRGPPQPSLANLDRLVDHVRATGLVVDLEVEGTAGAVPPGVDLSAYRIVQEALTNVIKHAGANAHAFVLVGYGEDEVVVSVGDDGVGRREHSGGGHGLAGIRERVAVVGGSVEAGPGPDGGFVVTARLPYALEPTT